VNITNDAEEIVFGSQDSVRVKERGLAGNSVVDLAENEEQEINVIPGELQRRPLALKYS
jgi:hypothetical protein